MANVDNSFWTQLAKDIPAPTKAQIEAANRKREPSVKEKDLKDYGISKKDVSDDIARTGPTGKAGQGTMTDKEYAAAMAAMKEDAKYYKYDDDTFGAEDITAGGYSALNSALFGIPDIIVKSANTDAYKKLQALKERNKTANFVGELTGAVVPTPALIAGAVGKGAKAASLGLKAGKAATAAGKVGKAADTASDFLRASGKFADVAGAKGLGQAALRGGVEAGLQAAPRALSGEADASDALLATGLGAGIGVAGKILPSALRSAGLLNKGEAVSAPLEDILVDKELAARGLSGRDIKQAMNSTASALGVNRVGNIVNNADDVKRAALAVLKKNDILNPDEARAFIQGTGKKFEILNNAFDKSGMRVIDLADDIAADPAIVAFVAEHGDDGQKLVDDMVAKYSSHGSLNDIKSAITKDIQFANKSTDRLASDAGDVATAIKNKLDDAVLALDPAYDSYKADWRALQPLRTMVARDKASIAKASGGSDTVAKVLATSMLGGSAGAALSGFDPNDESTWTPAAMKAIAGIAIGASVNKVVPGITNYAAGQVAGALNNPKFLGALDKIGLGLSKADVAGAMERFIAAQKTEETPEETREKLGEIQPDSEILRAKARSRTSDTSKFFPKAGTSASPADEAGQVRADQYGEAYMDKLNQAMAQYWMDHFSDSMTFDEYKGLVAKKTDGFAPEKSASFLYPDKKDRQTFLRDLRVTRDISNVDLDQVYRKAGFLSDKSERAEIAKGQNDLVDAIASLVTDPGAVPTKTAVDTIKADLASIKNLKADPAEKRNMLFELLSTKYALGLDSIRELGLA